MGIFGEWDCVKFIADKDWKKKYFLMWMLTGGGNGKFKVLTVSEDKLGDSSNHLSRQSEATMSESSVKFVFVDSLGSLPPLPSS